MYIDGYMASSQKDASVERSFARNYRQKMWMDQRPTIKKHDGGMMILVIVITVSARLSFGE